MKLLDQAPPLENLYQPNADELAALQFDFGVRPNVEGDFGGEGGQRQNDRRGSNRRDGDYRQRDDRRPGHDDSSVDRPDATGSAESNREPSIESGLVSVEVTVAAEVVILATSQPQPIESAVPENSAATSEPEADSFGTGVE